MPAIPWKIRVSPRFELFLALWSVLSGKATRHGEWRANARARLGADFHRTIEALGGAAELWILFFDAPGLRPPEKEIGEVLTAIRRRPAADLAQGLLSTLLHSPEIGARVFAQRDFARRGSGRTPAAQARMARLHGALSLCSRSAHG